MGKDFFGSVGEGLEKWLCGFLVTQVESTCKLFGVTDAGWSMILRLLIMTIDGHVDFLS